MTIETRVIKLAERGKCSLRFDGDSKRWRLILEVLCDEKYRVYNHLDFDGHTPEEALDQAEGFNNEPN